MADQSKLEPRHIGALLAVLSDYAARPCHDDHEHGRGICSFGWSPEEIADLAEAERILTQKNRR